MDYFPVFANLAGQRCLVVGGGAVAARKVRALRKSGARITVNAPALNEELRQLAADGAIDHHPGLFDAALIREHLLIVAATPDRAVNTAVAMAARQAQRLCNVVDDGNESGFIMPSVVDRNPVLIAIGTGGRSPVLARMLRQQLDEWLPTRIGSLAEWAGQWRSEVKARCKTHAARLRFWERILNGSIAERILAGDTATATRRMIRELSADATSPEPGEAWIVGAGPGDPGLITRRGLQLLQRADVVMHDRLIAAEVLELARKDAEFIGVGKQASGPSTPQDDINALLIDLVRRGKRVCRLKGGDPLVFGRGGEEIAALADAGLCYEVVPGISAANGCAASAGIPLTHRGVASGVTLVTGRCANGDPEPDWASLATLRHTLVVYMGARQLDQICAALTKHGRAARTPAAVVENGTTGQQRVVGGTLKSLPARAKRARVGRPSLLIVGEVVGLADKLHWLTDGPTEPEQHAAGGVA